MSVAYQPLIVALAVLVGVVAFYGAADLLAHGRASRGASRAWHAAAVLMLALAIWSITFLGTLAVRIRQGAQLVPVGYDLVEMLLPLLTAGVAVAAALGALGRRPGRALGRHAAAILLAAGIAASQHLVIAAMRTPAAIVHDVRFAIAAVLVALAGSYGIAVVLQPRPALGPAAIRHRILGAVLASVVVATAHFVGAAGLTFSAARPAMYIEPRQLIATDAVVGLLSAVVMVIIGLVLLTTSLDRRLARVSAEAARQGFLLDAARELASTLDPDSVIDRVGRLLVPRVADYCIIHLVSADGTLRQAAAFHEDAGRQHLLDELGAVYTPDPGNGRSLVARSVRATEPILAEGDELQELVRTTGDGSARRVLAALAPAACLVVPLVAHGERLGAITLASATSGRRFTQAELTVAELFATRAALAVHNARLYDLARAAREAEIRASQLEAQIAQARLETLRAQLNPHFLFNALNTVAMLVRQQAAGRALHAIVSLATLLRRLLRQPAPLATPLAAELSLLESYVTIEQLRLGSRLEVERAIADDVREALVPDLLLQPLVENAIRHGVARQASGGRVRVAAQRDGDRLVLEVRDTGPGFPRDTEARAGIGLANTRERLRAVFGSEFAMALDSPAGGGARVRISIPFTRATAT